MCGIAGFIHRSGSKDQLIAKGEKMIASLQHRGPDSGDTWFNENSGVLLGHRRLSIQDLSPSGHQPMTSSSGRYCITYNGEIYNFRELRDELSQSGFHFKGGSDTEVLLAAIENWGLKAAASKFVGMFAFALWDFEEKCLFLCRDRLGEKPLYFGWLPDAFYFASELKAIEAVVDKTNLSIDVTALGKFLQYGYISAPLSIYTGIYKLYPGTIITIGNHRESSFSPWPEKSDYSPQTYWSAEEAYQQGSSQLINNEADALDELRNVLERNIKRQLIADVDVGVFLSGGIDSSLVTAIAQDLSHNPVRSFTIGFEAQEYDESIYAERIAKHLGTDHTTIRVSASDAKSIIPSISSIYDEPFADSSQIPAFLVAKLAKQHVTVCLSGDGGDELFAGYNRYIWANQIWNTVRHIPSLARKVGADMISLLAPALAAVGQKRSQFKNIDLKLQKLSGFLRQKTLYGGYDYLLSSWQPSELKGMLKGYNRTSSGFNFNTSKMQFIDYVMLCDQVGYLEGDNLTKVDRASMAVGLETRLPLLSHEVQELAWRIPLDMKVRNTSSKWLLKELLASYMPRDMFERPKMGFSVPVAQWLRGDLREWGEDILASRGASVDGLIDTNKVNAIWSQHVTGKADHSSKLWAVLMVAMWKNERL